MADVDINVEGDLSPEAAEDARRRLASLQQDADLPFMGGRLTLRHVREGRTRWPYVADARVIFDGRNFAAHTAGRTPEEAIEQAEERLRRRLRDLVGAAVARRNEPRVLQKALEDLEPDRQHRPEGRVKPAEEREVVRRRSYADHPEATYEAIADMLDLDEEFHLFRHARSGEDVVVYRRDDRRVGLIHPQASVLADETDDVVIAEASRYSEPLTLDRARAEMDIVNHRFLYYIDAQDGRGRVLYLRHDGDYGLVEPQ
jgi:sigma 54 modulation/S30EA-like ribosomal protein